MIKNISNRRGDIPVTILVLGVLLICMFAILSFYISDSNVRKNSEGIGVVKEAATLLQKHAFYQNAGMTVEEADELVGADTDALGKHIFIKRGKISVRYSVP